MSFGVALILLGLGAYFLSDTTSFTALIPAFFGAPLLGLGALARNERFRKHAMHGAMGLALLGLFGTFGGLLKLPTLLAGGELARPTAVLVQSIMAVLSIGYLAVGIKSFIAARRAQ